MRPRARVVNDSGTGEGRGASAMKAVLLAAVAACAGCEGSAREPLTCEASYEYQRIPPTLVGTAPHEQMFEQAHAIVTVGPAESPPAEGARHVLRLSPRTPSSSRCPQGTRPSSSRHDGGSTRAPSTPRYSPTIWPGWKRPTHSRSVTHETRRSVSSSPRVSSPWAPPSTRS